MAYQVKDGRGNVIVTQPSAVRLRIAFGTDSIEVACDTSGTQSSSRRYVGYCSGTSLSLSWFLAGGAANVSVALRDSADVADVATVTLPALLLHAKPLWWDSALRSTIPHASLLPQVDELFAGG